MIKKRYKLIVTFIIFEIIFIPLLAIGLIYYGPFIQIKEMLVTTAMTTMTQQYIAKWFLSDEEINKILEKNRPNYNLGYQNLESIEIDYNDNLNGIELINISASTFKGKLLVIEDPSRVKLIMGDRILKNGNTVSDIVRQNDAIAGINAGGYVDLGRKEEYMIPSGLVVNNEEIISGNTEYNYAVTGLNSDNKLIVSNSMNYNTLIEKGVSDAVSFGPVIIQDGIPTISSFSDGGMGIQPRTAIAQRKDGAILFLVIDGRTISSLGATLKNVQDVLLEHGAYNAFNLDGGSTTTMVYNDEVINHPSDFEKENLVPCAFIVKKSPTSEVDTWIKD